MAAFRCTAKLLKAMKAVPNSQPQPARNRLGEWTANLVRISHIQLVIAVSEPTRFGVAIDAAPYRQVPERFQYVLFHALLNIGVPPEAAAEEAEATLPLELAASNSRSVLGTLNQYAAMAAHHIYGGDARSAGELTMQLSEMLLLKPEGIGFPADRVLEAFGLPPLDHRLELESLLPPSTSCISP